LSQHGRALSWLMHAQCGEGWRLERGGCGAAGLPAQLRWMALPHEGAPPSCAAASRRGIRMMPAQPGRVHCRKRCTVRLLGAAGRARHAEHAHSGHGACFKCVFVIAARGCFAANTRTRNACAQEHRLTRRAFGRVTKWCFLFVRAFAHTQHMCPATAATFKVPLPVHSVLFLFPDQRPGGGDRLRCCALLGRGHGTSGGGADQDAFERKAAILKQGFFVLLASVGTACARVGAVVGPARACSRWFTHRLAK
jgi:hypothetical protein